MRTTVVIDDQVLLEAKRRAAEGNTSLSRIIELALRDWLVERPEEAQAPFSMITYGDPTRRMTSEQLARAVADAEEADDRRALGLE